MLQETLQLFWANSMLIAWIASGFAALATLIIGAYGFDTWFGRWNFYQTRIGFRSAVGALMFANWVVSCYSIAAFCVAVGRVFSA